MTTANRAHPRRPSAPSGGGVLLALISAASFATSGAFAHALFSTGWSPAAVVTARLAVAAAVLVVPAIIILRGRWRALLRQAPTITAYGLIAVAGCQVCYYLAVQRLSIGVALLLEYTSPLLIVGGTWLVSRVAPRRLTLVGCLVSMAGLALVLDVLGGLRLDALGVLFGLLAAAGNAFYFIVSARRNDDLSPIVLTAGGLLIGAVALSVLGGIGLLPMSVSSSPVRLLGAEVSWVVPVLGVALVAAALAYSAGIAATRRLGATVASFLGLAEVIFAVLWGWLFVGEAITLTQLIGGLVILTGVLAIRLDALRSERAADLRGKAAPQHDPAPVPASPRPPQLSA